MLPPIIRKDERHDAYYSLAQIPCILWFSNRGGIVAFKTNVDLDEIDLRILAELQRNARTSYSELGRRVGLTPPAVAERMRRMEECRVILGYRADIDLARVGLDITAFVRMRASGGTTCAELGTRMADIPEILECHRVTGEDSYIAKVAVRSVGHLQDLIDRMMPHAETITSVVLSSVVTNRVVGPGGQEPKAVRGGRRRTA
jgi:Lrp/AsnC family leucine-responsive transcriptional regulator